MAVTDSSQTLPTGFQHLECWVADWVLPDTQARSDHRLASSMEAIQSFYDAMLPEAPRILELLAKSKLGELDRPEERLLALMLSFAEVTPAVEFYKQPAVVDGFSSDKFLANEILSDLNPQS